MRIEIHYFADDDTEFDTREECEAYERSLLDDFDSVMLFDKDWNIMRREDCSVEYIANYMMYIKILDGERATKLMKWMYSYTGVCNEGLDELVTGDIYAWDNDEGVWFCPSKKLRELKKIEEDFEKAVNQMG